MIKRSANALRLLFHFKFKGAVEKCLVQFLSLLVVPVADEEPGPLGDAGLGHHTCSVDVSGQILHPIVPEQIHEGLGPQGLRLRQKAEILPTGQAQGLGSAAGAFLLVHKAVAAFTVNA